MWYSEQDFKDGCSFNFIMGAGAGIVGLAIAELILVWGLGWI